MKYKFLGLLVITLVAFIVLPLGSAFTVTLDKPADNAVVSGTTTLNATVTAGENVLNCTFYAKSALTANSTWSQLATVTNDTIDDTVFNTTYDTTGLEDSNDYVFNVTCQSATSTASDNNTGITVDNTVPDAPTSLSPANHATDSDGKVTFSATVTDSKTTSCTLYFGARSYPMTYSGSSCSYTLSNIPESTYTWYVKASDGTNTTSSETYQINIDIQKSASKSAWIQQQIPKSEPTGLHTLKIIAEDGIEWIKENKTTLAILALVVLIACMALLPKRKRYY